MQQLSDLYFYRWLCRGELGKGDAAWDDLVQAARLAPGRVIDASRVPPRALSAWKRAAAAVAALAHARLVVDAPADARVTIDGNVVHAAIELPIGRHFVRVETPGLEPFGAVVLLAAKEERVSPTLRPRRAPDVESLASTGRVLLGAFERNTAGWRFVLRQLEIESGKLASEGLAVGEDTPARSAVAALTRRLVGAPAPLLAAAPPAPAAKASEKRRTWLWVTIGGGVTIAAALAISLGVVYGRGTPSGTVSASLSGLR